MNRRASLNDRQLRVLRLIGDGSNLSEPEREGDRITGRALASRGLVTISRRGGMWSAAITAAGQHYLEHGCHPESPQHQGPESEDDPVRTAKDLVGRLLSAADKVVRVERPDEATRSLYRRAVHAAQTQELIPEGFLLQHTGRDRGDIIIRLSRLTNLLRVTGLSRTRPGID